MQESTTIQDQTQALEHLEKLIQLDTLYRDHYLRRARVFLEGVLSYDSYRDIKRQQTLLANLPNKIRNAIGDGNWTLVRALSEEYNTLKEEVERKLPLKQIAETVYEGVDPPIDPFSPGMNTIPGVTRQNQDLLLKEVETHLTELSRFDKSFQTFYASRIKAFQKIHVADEAVPGQARPLSGHSESEALKALEEGNFSKLEEIAESLSSKLTVASPTRDISNQVPDISELPGYLYEFNKITLKNAQTFGLEFLMVPSHHQEFAPFCRFAWHPAFAETQGNPSGVLRVPAIPFPDDTPDALKARVQLFATHPMINSGGIRFLPSLVSEDVLVETFDESAPGSISTQSKLLAALGLSQRKGLSRRQIEAALLTHGDNILKNELDLDPFQFKLICIPPDLHLRIGLERGWGQQKLWTHFDGYLVMMDGTLHPLAGGDIRFGGIYDLLGLSHDYASDNLIVRFAVVQRRRMALWNT